MDLKRYLKKIQNKKNDEKPEVIEDTEPEVIEDTEPEVIEDD